MFHLLASAVLCHYKITAPPTRGYEPITEDQAPCGLAPGAVKTITRTQFPIKGGKIGVYSAHTKATIQFYVAFTANPVMADFKQLMPQADFVLGDSTSQPVDFTSFADAKVGGNATVQLRYDGSDGLLYQCGDITFLQSTTSSAISNAWWTSLLVLAL